MIRLFSASDSSFVSNGDKILTPLKCEIYESDKIGEDYSVDMDLPISDQEYIEENRIVAIDTPNKGNQLFRINKIDKKKNRISVTLLHVTSDLKNYLVRDSNVVGKTCSQAMTQLLNAADGISGISSPFSVASDISRSRNLRCVRDSLFQAFEVIAERWDGHWWRDNWTFSILDDIGVDHGVNIEYGKNIEDITKEENWSDVVTRLLPVGANEIMLNTNPATGAPTSADPYVYAQDVSYPVPYTKTVSFEQDLVQDDYPNEEAYRTALISDLRSKAESYIEINQYPKVNYTLKANVEKVTGIGDTIVVIDRRLGINITTQVISYKYDYILKKFKELEFGNFRKSLNNLVSIISANTVENVNRVYGQQIGTISSDVSTLSGDVSGLSTDVSTLDGNVSALAGDVSTLDGNVSSLSSTVAGMVNASAMISKTSSSAAQSFTQTASKVTSLTGSSSDTNYFTIASSQITIKKAGIYLIAAELTPTAGSSSTTWTMAIRSSTDNDYICRGICTSNASESNTICASCVLSRSANDVISVYLAGSGSIPSSATSDERNRLYIIRLSD